MGRTMKENQQAELARLARYRRNTKRLGSLLFICFYFIMVALVALSIYNYMGTTP